MKVDASGIDSVLAQMRAIAEQARAAPAVTAAAEGERTDFGAVLKESIDSVNATSKQAGELAKAFERGDPGVELAEVMIALNKSSISFQAMVQVRNRLVEAYRDISRMSI